MAAKFRVIGQPSSASVLAIYSGLITGFLGKGAEMVPPS